MYENVLCCLLCRHFVIPAFYVSAQKGHYIPLVKAPCDNMRYLRHAQSGMSEHVGPVIYLPAPQIIYKFHLEPECTIAIVLSECAMQCDILFRC